MRRVFVIGSAFLFFALLASAAGNDAPASGRKQPAASFPVRVDLLNGDKLEGTMELGVSTIETGTGSQSVRPQFIRRITLNAPEGKEAQDSVQLTDKNIIRGHLEPDSFLLDTRDFKRIVTRAEVREIRILRPVDESLLGIVLGLVTLAAMEIVLGIDNIIFLAIVAGRLPAEKQPRARKIGLAAALGTRLLLLFSLTFLLGLTKPVFTLPDLPLLHDLAAREISWRDIILLVGGTFLIGKSVFEMHERLEDAKHDEPQASPKAVSSFARVIATIAVVDIVFSLDSVITAVGMVDELWVMVTAMVIAMGVMMLFSEKVARFVERHPTIKVLALSFLILIGVMLVVEGLGQHIDKGYIYFAMAFAVGVEMVNLRLRKGHAKPNV